MLCRNCLIKHVIVRKVDGNVEVTGKRGIIRKQLLDSSKETRRYLYHQLKERELARTFCGTRFGRDNRLVLRQTTWMEQEMMIKDFSFSAEMTMYIVSVMSQTVKHFDWIQFHHAVKVLTVKEPRFVIMLYFLLCGWQHCKTALCLVRKTVYTMPHNVLPPLPLWVVSQVFLTGNAGYRKVIGV